jgi:hypothetical protein
MPSSITVDLFSATTVPVEMIFDDTLLSLGTGFIWHSIDVSYLITNWHNVSGRDCFTEKNLSATGAWPNKLNVYLNTKGRLGHKFCESFELYDNHKRPNWFVHPTLGRKIDIVALPLNPRVEPDWYAMNQLELSNLSVNVGQDVFILGYPFGIGPSGYPIWKRGSVASEPEFRSLEQPYILVDSASRPGMSGSPVIRRTWGYHPMANGDLLETPGAKTRFVGIYSGRLNTIDPNDAQLGLVWPSSFIVEIVAGKFRDLPS